MGHGRVFRLQSRPLAAGAPPSVAGDASPLRRSGSDFTRLRWPAQVHTDAEWTASASAMLRRACADLWRAASAPAAASTSSAPGAARLAPLECPPVSALCAACHAVGAEQRLPHAGPRDRFAACKPAFIFVGLVDRFRRTVPPPPPTPRACAAAEALDLLMASEMGPRSHGMPARMCPAAQVARGASAQPRARRELIPQPGEGAWTAAACAVCRSRICGSQAQWQRSDSPSARRTGSAATALATAQKVRHRHQGR